MTMQGLRMQDVRKPDAAALAHPADAGGDVAAAPDGATPARRVSDVAVGLAIVAMALAVWAGTTTFDDVPAALTQGMGPAAFPRLVLGVIIVLALWLALTASRREPLEDEPVRPMVYATLAAMGGVVGAMLLFGIHGAVLAACIGLGRLWGERRLLLLASIALGLSIAIHFAFVRGFGVGLPRGLLQIWPG
jgi:putative tricarboxylic transport membrane protein